MLAFVPAYRAGGSAGQVRLVVEFLALTDQRVAWVRYSWPFGPGEVEDVCGGDELLVSERVPANAERGPLFICLRGMGQGICRLEAYDLHLRDGRTLRVEVECLFVPALRRTLVAAGIPLQPVTEAPQRSTA